MTRVLMTEHPAWTETASGRARAVRTASGIWALRWDSDGLHMNCVVGTEDVKPQVIGADPASLPETVVPGVKAGLVALGTVHRVANPSLWDAITTAILRQVVQAAQARKLYRRWCTAYGTAVGSAPGDLRIAPPPGQVLALADEHFASIGAKFHRAALSAAAAAYERHGVHWHRMDARDLIDALTSIPRIGPWTASAAAADYTGDFPVYPHDDLAVRTWAAKIAPSHDWPDKKDKAFGPMWTGMAGSDRTALHTLTLSTLAWGSHAR